MVREQIKKQFLPYQITQKHLARLHKDAIFLPCPPVTRGQEVSYDAMNSNLCMNYQAKEYLLHSQNAIAEMVIKNRNKKQECREPN
jgi:ornithine carbamoyltransferase